MTTVQEALDEYLMAAKADGLSVSTVKWYKSLLTTFARRVSGLLTAVTTKRIRQYIIDLREQGERYIGAPQKPKQDGKLSDATIAGHITALHAFFKWCADEYQIANPMANIKRARRREPTVKAIAPGDFIKLLESTNQPRDRALLAFLADTGCRLGGLLALQIDDVDFVHRRALVHEKGAKSRQVVFTGYTAALLKKWLDVRRSGTAYVFVSLSSGEQLTASGVNQLLKRLKAKAQVKGRVNPHSFRHSFAREYIKNGGDVVTLAKLLGHSDINTTAAYYAVFTQDELAQMHGKYSLVGNLEREA